VALGKDGVGGEWNGEGEGEGKAIGWGIGLIVASWKRRFDISYSCIAALESCCIICILSSFLNCFFGSREGGPKSEKIVGRRGRRWIARRRRGE
jgi:hypothetical protein